MTNEPTRPAGAGVAVFDAARQPVRIVHATEEYSWSPPRLSCKPGGPVVRYGSDGPSIEHRLRAQSAWISSQRYSGQAANDNEDWPLAKLLRTEGQDELLAMAERYRQMYDAANSPTELRGTDAADNIYLMSDTRLDESTGALVDKGAKRVKGRKARADEPPRQALRTRVDQPKAMSARVPKKWNGDWPLLNKIDAGRDLAAAQAALGPVREAFEAAVIGGETLEAIGRDHGVGNKTGAKGAGRALVYLGLQYLDEHWRSPRHRAA